MKLAFHGGISGLSLDKDLSSGVKVILLVQQQSHSMCCDMLANAKEIKTLKASRSGTYVVHPIVNDKKRQLLQKLRAIYIMQFIYG